MRAVVVRPGPRFSVQDVCDGWVSGLRENGVEVVDFNFDDRMTFYSSARVGDSTEACFNPVEAALMASKGLEATCYEVWPEVVVIVSGFFLPAHVYDLLRSRGHKVVLIHTESPYEDDRQVVRSQHADVNIVNDPTNLDRFANRAVYLPHAYRPDLHHRRPVTPDAASDFCFVGTGFPSRIEFLERVDWSGIDFALAGNWPHIQGTSLEKHMAHPHNECCPADQTAILYASTKASANLYRKEATESADGWAMGPREVELAACGTFFLREPRPEGDELFPMLPTFTEPGDFEEKLRWWLDHDDARDTAARQAHEAVADRTFANHAAQLLTLLAA